MINHLAGDAPVSRKGAQAGQPGLSEFHSENSLSMATFLDSFQVRLPFHSVPPFTTQCFFPFDLLRYPTPKFLLRMAYRVISKNSKTLRMNFIFIISFHTKLLCLLNLPSPDAPHTFASMNSTPRWTKLLFQAFLLPQSG